MRLAGLVLMILCTWNDPNDLGEGGLDEPGPHLILQAGIMLVTSRSNLIHPESVDLAWFDIPWISVLKNGLKPSFPNAKS